MLKGPCLHGINPLISHNQFVDDNMLMEILSVIEARAIKMVLDEFMVAYGTSINQYKSHLLFFNTLVLVQFNISRIMGFRKSFLSLKYLGVPLLECC